METSDLHPVCEDPWLFGERTDAVGRDDDVCIAYGSANKTSVDDFSVAFDFVTAHGRYDILVVAKDTYI